MGWIIKQKRDKASDYRMTKGNEMNTASSSNETKARGEGERETKTPYRHLSRKGLTDFARYGWINNVSKWICLAKFAEVGFR